VHYICSRVCGTHIKRGLGDEVLAVTPGSLEASVPTGESCPGASTIDQREAVGRSRGVLLAWGCC
jgi:hypothetical protein